MPTQPEPNWQPLSALPMIANVIDGMLADTQEQYQTLLPAKEQPWVLDDALVDRVVNLFTTQRDDLWLFEEQLSRWQKLTLTTEQAQEITRLTEQMGTLREVNASILTLASELQENTIEQIMNRDDAQLALDVLSGKLKLPTDDVD